MMAEPRARKGKNMGITNERLMELVSELIDLALEATDNAAQVESRIRSVGFNDEELKGFGFDIRTE